MSANRKNDSLPPPAFPPGARRHVHHNSVHPHAEDGRPEGSEADPFIAPDDPLPARRDAVQRAFISPDEPFPRREAGAEGHAGQPGGLARAGASGDPLAGGGASSSEGIAMGIGQAPDHAAHEPATLRDPHVEELVVAVGKLAEAIRRKGEAGLRATPGMSRFEATLRSYCVGYLAGRRADSEAVEG